MSKWRNNLGGYSAEVPPLPIPNRVVKLSIADGTALRCGRVGSRHFRSPRGFIPEGSLFVSLRATATYSPFFCLSINLSVFSLAPFHFAKNLGIKINPFQHRLNRSAICFYFLTLTVPLPYLYASSGGLGHRRFSPSPVLTLRSCRLFTYSVICLCVMSRKVANARRPPVIGSMRV